jgi:hypothetical protein
MMLFGLSTAFLFACFENTGRRDCTDRGRSQVYAPQ